MQNMQRLIVAALVLLAWGCAQAKDGETSLAKAWSNGSVIVMTLDATPREADETYGDFAYYLNEFAASVEGNWAFFHHVSGAGGTDSALDVQMAIKPYSVVVFQRGNPLAYVHQGPILEPQVYQFIQHRFEDRAMPEYLQQFSPIPVNISEVPGTGRFRVSISR
ncbi:hypothetical protein ACFOZ5_08525 [Marinobacter lacisalsi]|uniref:Uncharacterized protein n=1 Tax=Marinobacter lacisalsi TaxID=475979 RepID=A0ABV8QFF0_9GAMM